MYKKLVVVFILVFGFFGIAFAADSMTGNTWEFDSAGAKTPQQAQIVWMYWRDCTTAGHQLAIHEYPSGNILWKATCIDDNIDLSMVFPGSSGYIDGIEVRTMQSGSVQIRLGKWNN